jgi:hypothetical protein
MLGGGTSAACRQDAVQKERDDVVTDEPILVLLYPSQLWVAEEMGWVRDRDYKVYSCLLCFKDMDLCTCPPDEEDDV